MSVERKVRTVDGEVVFEQKTEQFIPFAGPWMRRPPEQTVMDQEEICARSHCEPDGCQACVNGGGDTTDCPAILDLESVHRTIVILNCCSVQNPVAVLNDGI